MTPEQATALRKKFDAEVVGKLPKINCQACSKAQGKVCGEHNKRKCSVCGNYLTTAHVDLDFVGHGAVTDRLLTVDPEWTWEPLGVDANGLPALDRNGGLWIRLTIAGVTRLGYGDGPDPKQLIGDALRNAAMRFGVALDLWAKDGLESEQGDAAEPAHVPASAPETPAPAPQTGDERRCALCGFPFGAEAVRKTADGYVHKGGCPSNVPAPHGNADAEGGHLLPPDGSPSALPLEEVAS